MKFILDNQNNKADLKYLWRSFLMSILKDRQLLRYKKL